MNKELLEKMLKEESLKDIINKYISIVELELKNNSNEDIDFYDIHHKIKEMFNFLNKYSELKVINECLNKKECEYIINDFNKVLSSPVKTMEELEEILSEKFASYLQYSEDAQEACDNMFNLEYDGLMKKYPFVYSLSGKNEVWSVGIEDSFDYSKEHDYITIFNEVYDEEFEDISDVASKLENQIMKTMSNCGCDVFNAFNLIVQEDFPEDVESIFFIDNADGTPSIELFQLI